MKTTALIPIRAGSLRVKNKNTRAFAGSSLLELKIKELERCHLVSEIVVNTNDDKAAELAAQLGATVQIRDPYFASDTVSMNEVLRQYG